ncbi:MAG: GMC oxidoreductase, partial [Pseudomonadales bacterium]|nr:GMC oxidoreductase [Pseudomonadales bacterium]
RGVRWSGARAFLRPVQHRPNLTVITDALVTGLTLEGEDDTKRVTGVKVRTKSGNETFAARRAVVLAAGAVGSPHILQLSGIGRDTDLETIGVAQRHNLPGVGHNLQDHLQVRTIYKVSNTKTLNRRVNSVFGMASMGIEYLLRRTGPLTMPPSQLGAFAKSDPNQPTANIEWHVQPLSLDKFGDPLHKFDAITPSVCNLRPTSRGHVLARSADPAEPPAIQPNYLSTPEDEEVAVAGLKFTRNIMAQPALAQYQCQEWKPGPDAKNDEQLLQAARELGTTIFHPVSTCRMGSDPQAVVSDRLKVHGTEGLWVVDASIMPTITSGNTNAPTVMIAEKGADFVKADALAAN